MNKIVIGLLTLLMALPAAAQQPTTFPTDVEQSDTSQQNEEHVDFLGLPLNVTPQEMLDEMENRRLRFVQIDSAKQTYSLTGILSGIEIAVDMKCNKDLTKINYIRLSTPKHRNQHEDFSKVLHWLLKEYDEPDWKGTVRGHRFCRWFSDIDHDIIMIATGQGAVEVWFYENHLQRNIDYYSILKYCEKNPAPDVPFLTAMESVTWKRNDSIQVRKHVARRPSKRYTLRKQKLAKRMKARRKAKASKAKTSKAKTSKAKTTKKRRR